MSDDSGFQVPPELRDHAFSSWFADFIATAGWRELQNGPTPLDEIPAALGGTMQRCTHCGQPARGYARLAGGERVCHGDIGLDCYRRVTVYGEPLGHPPTWAQNTTDGTPTVKAGSFLVPDVNDLTIRKLSAIIEVPDELLMDAGVIPDTRPPRPPLPWRWRIRNRIGGWRESLARRAYRIIAGYDVYEPED